MHPPLTLDHAGIAARVPHAGSMCLLHRLLDWSASDIRCEITNHAVPDHPLRCADGLLSPVAIEYAGQAMALHAGLSAPAGSTPRAGFLASARNVLLHVPRLDTAAGPLCLHAQRLAGDGQQALYQFRLFDSAGACLVEGRTTVVLDGVPGAVAVTAATPQNPASA